MRWFAEICPPTAAMNGVQIGNSPDTGNCFWRKYPNIANNMLPPFNADGSFDMTAWMNALQTTSDPPLYAVRSDPRYGAYDRSVGAPFTTDNQYTGCLQTITGDPNGDANGVSVQINDAACAQILQGYQQLLSLLPAAVAAGAVSQAQATAAQEVISNLQASDFECRIVPSPAAGGPQTASSGQIDFRNVSGDAASVWTCLAGPAQTPDDPSDPACKKEFVFTNAGDQQGGYPPSSVACTPTNNIPKRPTKSAAECASMAQACGICDPTSPYPCQIDPVQPAMTPLECTDYYLYCGSLDDYCGTGAGAFSLVSKVCSADQGGAFGMPGGLLGPTCNPRCMERQIYCMPPLAPGGSCSTDFTNPIAAYCGNTNPLGCYPSDNGPPPLSGFRTQKDVATSLCNEAQARCSCAVSQPSGVPDYRCAFKIPVTRFNMTPTGIEAVLVEDHRSRWEQIFFGFSDGFSASGMNNAFPVCDTKGRTLSPSAGVIPALTIK